MPNPFIVIEALDAGGSQTQTDELGKKLKKAGFKVHQYHFPQEDRSTGRLIYDKFLLPKNKLRFTRREQSLLYIQDFYSRADEMHAELANISPPARGGARGGGSVVISDRFYTSTLAYQTMNLSGTTRKAMLNWLKWLTEKETPQLPKPTLVIFLDTPISVSLKHLSKKQKDYFETKQKLAAIRRSYLRLAQEEKWTVINSVDEAGQQRTVKDIHQEIWHHVQPLL